MPKTNIPKHKSTSFYLSNPVNQYLEEIAELMSENRSQVINRLIIHEYIRLTSKGMIELENKDKPQIQIL